MSGREDRERKIAGWLEHLQTWKPSAEALNAYAHSHGAGLWSMYYWRNVLRRERRWPRKPGEAERGQRPANAPDSPRAPMRFARITLEAACRSSSISVRAMLANGRRVEIELEEAQLLSEVLSALRSAA